MLWITNSFASSSHAHDRAVTRNFDRKRSKDAPRFPRGDAYCGTLKRLLLLPPSAVGPVDRMVGPDNTE